MGCVQPSKIADIPRCNPQNIVALTRDKEYRKHLRDLGGRCLEFSQHVR